jgi:predicted nucleic acid-binding protein
MQVPSSELRNDTAGVLRRAAATALPHDVPVVTQDADYGALAAISDLRVIAV